jgi:hypothetical protein
MNLVLYQPGGEIIGVSEEAQRLKDEALSAFPLVEVVKTKAENDLVNAGVQKIHDLLAALDEAFKEVKRPALERCQQLDELRRELRKDLLDEELRGNQMCGDWQQHEALKFQDAIKAQNECLSELERERFKARSEAKTDRERDLIEVEFAQRAAAMPMPQLHTAPGQKVKEDWDIEVTSYAALIVAYPACVHCEPNMSEIRRLLDMGITLPGVKAERKVVSKVRKSRNPKSIEIRAA